VGTPDDPQSEAEPSAVDRPRIAVIIPCYRVKRHILEVLSSIGDWADAIYCVDDACPDGSGAHVRAECSDPRVRVVARSENGGVGAATMTGYAAAIADGCEVLVKIDGDGQMDPRYGPDLLQPILSGEADYAKGNRFFSMETVSAMPMVRLIGNAGLSFMSKLSTGYWDLFDPTNGYTALEARVAAELPFDKIHNGYFFESDLLFRLSLLRARVVELPQMAVYADEKSGLSELRALLTFPGLHVRNFAKRVSYNYFLRNFSTASITLVAGLLMTIFGFIFGVTAWTSGAQTDTAATAGTVMLAGLPVLLGLQFLLNFLTHDMNAVPSTPIHRRLSAIRPLGAENRPLAQPSSGSGPGGSRLPERLTEWGTLTFGCWALLSWVAVYAGASFNGMLWLTALAAVAGTLAWRWVRRDPDDPDPSTLPEPERSEEEKPRVPVAVPIALLAASGGLLVLWHSHLEWWLAAWGVGVLYLISVWLLAPGFPKLSVAPRATGRDWVALILAGIAGAILSNFLAVGNWDDAYYLNAVVSAIRFPDYSVLSFDGMYGEEGLPIQQLIHRPQTFEIFVATVSVITGVSPQVTYYGLLPMLFGFACAVPTWLIYKTLHPRGAWLATLITVAVLFVWGGGGMSYGSFAYSRMFQGKGVFVTLFVPLIAYMALRYSQRPNARNWVLLVTAQAGGAICTSTALVVAPMVAGLVLLTGTPPSRRGLRDLVIGLAASLPMIIVLLLVRWEVATQGELLTTGVTVKWSVVLGKDVARRVYAMLALLTLPLLMTTSRLRSAPWTLRYVAVCFILVFNGVLAPLLNEHVAKVFSWRTYWAVPMPALVSLCFAAGIYGFVRVLADGEKRTRLLLPAFGAALLVAFWTGGPNTYNPRQSVGFHLPKGGKAVWSTARKVAKLARPDSLVLAPDGVSSRLAGMMDRPRLIVIRGFYLRNMTRAWGEDETNARKRMSHLVKGKLAKARWDAALNEIDRRCIDMVVFSPRGSKQGLQPLLRRRHFEKAGFRIFKRTDEAHEACLDGRLDELPTPKLGKPKNPKKKKKSQGKAKQGKGSQPRVAPRRD
jgi:glycosyltransferase involved in cell wall biosynthesis